MRELIKQLDYLAHAKHISLLEEEYIQKFIQWLPANIIDCHAHCNLAEHVRSVDSKTFNHMLSTFVSFSLEESKEWNSFFHPEKNIRTLRFAKTFSGVNHREANRYLLSCSPAEDRVALYGLPDDIDYTCNMLSHPRVSALKMYHSYLEPSSKEIYQFFPKPVLEEAQSLSIPIVLHTPTNIVKCFEQLERLLFDFPRLQICIAHLGLVKYLISGLEDVYAFLSKFTNVFMDTSLVPSAEVISLSIKYFGYDRIMFGSDAPLNLIRSVSYNHPVLGERIVTSQSYHWTNEDEFKEYGHLAKNAVHAHWQSLDAIKNALMVFSPMEERIAKEKIFYKNAHFFYSF